MNSRPFFSVVMPTHNRAGLLPQAVRSVLNQTFGDFEIIISDNFSSDETPQIAQSFGDKRIKYFRSGKSLSMGDSFEFALSHANGEYVSFLSDDDAYAKVFLETLYRVSNEQNAEVVTCKIAPYFADCCYEYGRSIAAQSMLIQSFDRKIFTLEKAEAVSFLFDKFRLSSNKNIPDFINIPLLVNTIYHSSIIEKINRRISKLFPVVSSDIYTSVLFLNTANRFCYINEPLYLQAIWKGSTTSGDQSLFERYPEESKFDFVPLKKLLSLQNYNTNTVLRAKADWGKDFQQFPVEWSNYFISSFQEIMYEKISGVDVAQELKEFETVLSKQDEELQRKVKIEISKYSLQREKFKNRLKDTDFGKLLLKLKHRNIQILDGVGSITECGNLINTDFLDKYADKRSSNFYGKRHSNLNANLNRCSEG